MKIALSRVAERELTDAFRYYEHEQHGATVSLMTSSMHDNSSRNCRMHGIRLVRRYDAVYCATSHTA